MSPSPSSSPRRCTGYQGVVLLLAGEELEFDPIEVEGMSPIGEEALPQDVRAGLSAKVAHGFKYVGGAPPVRVRLKQPQKEAAKFDVQTSTLLTLDEGALRGQASADVTIKSGRFKELVFRLDPSMTVLDVVAPALLKFNETEAGGARVVTATFTEEMEGTLRVGLSFERILDRETKRLDLAPIIVTGADVQRGHVALASSAAVELEGLPGDSIHAIGVDELPRSLSSATTSPILLAYKYSHLPYELAVGITQHEVISPVDSRIVSAELRTTMKPQGNALSQARYVVVNQSRQFLRVELPEGAELFQAVVNGKTVRPARGGDGRLIVPLPRSDESFPISLDYAMNDEPFGFAGRLHLRAPKPDLFVGSLAWGIELPQGYGYRGLSTNLSSGDDVEPRGGVTFWLRRDLIAPEDEAAALRLTYLREIGARGVDFFVGFLSLAFALLLLRAGSASRAERLITASIALGAILVTWMAGASPWALVAPMVLVGLAAYLVQPARRRPEPEAT